LCDSIDRQVHLPVLEKLARPISIGDRDKAGRQARADTEQVQEYEAHGGEFPHIIILPSI
jgi:hypothetical protein